MRAATDAAGTAASRKYSISNISLPADVAQFPGGL
jgi:hypothetical protein